MTLGEQIRAHRIRLGLSQDALAERMEVSRQAVTKWESGRSAPSTDKLLKLSALFDCTLDELAGKPATQAAPEEALAPSDPIPAEPKPDRYAAVRRRCHAALLVAAVWIGHFFLCKLIWAELADQTVLNWLFGDSSRHHAYLFGWLLDKYWYCALIAVAAALFGMFRFSVVTTGAFFLALPLGELLGQLRTGPGVHQGWLIWGGIYQAGILLGAAAQRMKQDFRRSRLWWAAAAVAVIAVILLALANPPQYA